DSSQTTVQPSTAARRKPSARPSSLTPPARGPVRGQRPRGSHRDHGELAARGQGVVATLPGEVCRDEWWASWAAAGAGEGLGRYPGRAGHGRGGPGGGRVA